MSPGAENLERADTLQRGFSGKGLDVPSEVHMNLDGQRRTDELIELDGGSFVDATLTRCRLVYRGGSLPVVAGNDHYGRARETDSAVGVPNHSRNIRS